MEYSYSYGYNAADTGTEMAVLGGFMIVVWIFAIAISVITLVAAYKIFKKCGEEGWKAIVPIYNIITEMKICKLNPIWIIGMFIPIVNSIASILLSIAVSIRLAQGFGKGTGFILGLIFLAPIFWLILAFNGDTWDSSRINMDTLSFLNDKNATPTAAPAAGAQSAQPTQDPWVNGQNQA